MEWFGAKRQVFGAIVALVLVAWVGLAGAASAEKRTAFIVGNADYANALPLANPVNDARLVADTLEGLGFDVTLATDLTRAGLAAEFSAFLDRTEGADVTLFYYAGHGMQFEGRNYLLGTDAALRSALDVESEALPLDRIVQMLEEKSRAALVFVDACRDNPLATRFYTQNFSPTRALATRGLAPMTGRFQGSMLMFAASPGQVAYDGASGNSPFTAALARHLPTENIEILTLMKRVIRDVRAETGDLQVPTVTNDLALEVYLRKDRAVSAGVEPIDEEKRAYDAAMSVSKIEAWDFFLGLYPSGRLSKQAKEKRKELEGSLSATEHGRKDALGSESTMLFLPSHPFDEPEDEIAKVVRLTQIELNRIGCEAGAVDGRPGAMTHSAAERYARLSLFPSYFERLGSHQFLEYLRNETDAICSAHWAMQNKKDEYEGTWKWKITCPGQEIERGSMTLFQTEDGRFEGTFKTSGTKRPVAASLRLTSRGSGAIVHFVLDPPSLIEVQALPSPREFSINGFTSVSNCAFEARRAFN